MLLQKLPQFSPHFIVTVVWTPAAGDFAGPLLVRDSFTLPACEVVRASQSPIKVSHEDLDRPSLPWDLIELLE